MTVIISLPAVRRAAFYARARELYDEAEEHDAYAARCRDEALKAEHDGDAVES